jgi:diguanylate cyclase (GGDEF)-like protein
MRPHAAAVIDPRITTLVLGLVTAGALTIVLWPGSRSAGWVLPVVGLISAAAVVMRTRWHRPPHRDAWWALATGVLLVSMADGLAVATPRLGDGGPVVAIALSGAGALALTAGTVLLDRRRDRSVDRDRQFASIAVVISVALLGWVMMAAPVAARHPGSAANSLWAALAGDVLIVGGVVGLVSHRTLRGASLGWMLAATGTRCVAHLGAAVGPGSVGVAGPLVSALLLLSVVGWGAAAAAPPTPESSETSGGIHRGLSALRILAVVAVLLVPTAALVIQRLSGVEFALWPVVAAALALTAVVTGRLASTLGEFKALDRERRHVEDELAYQAAHDSLTGLPNRAESMRLIQAGLSRAQRSGATVGLLFVDLDGFKAINDSLGHRAGDEVLRNVAHRMREEVRAGDVVGRLGGDEFVVLLEPLDADVSAVSTAERLVQAIGVPVALSDGRQVGIGASVGVAISQDGSTDPDLLLHEADVAVYRAKQTGRGRTEVFDQRLRRELRERAVVEAGVVGAIQNDELVVHYQPIVDVQTQEVLGYEALVRWRRPDGKLVAPAEFILIAEQSDLICDLDTWVLQRATQQLAAWNERLGRSTLFIAVNVSGRHIIRPRLRDDVGAALQASGIEPRQLVLEVTETALIDDSLALTNLETLRRTGVSISIDDFGSGYNSIARLEQLPVDIVKVDSRFLSRGGPSTNKLLRLIVQAAHAFGLPVVAEGVEHHFELEMLQSIECESAQGYYLGRPLDPAEIVIEEVVRGRVGSKVDQGPGAEPVGAARP